MKTCCLSVAISLSALLLSGAVGCRHSYDEGSAVEAALTKDRPDGVPVRSPGSRLNGEPAPNRRSIDDLVPSPPASVLGTRAPSPPPPATRPVMPATQPAVRP